MELDVSVVAFRPKAAWSLLEQGIPCSNIYGQSPALA